MGRGVLLQLDVELYIESAVLCGEGEGVLLQLDVGLIESAVLRGEGGTFTA